MAQSCRCYFKWKKKKNQGNFVDSQHFLICKSLCKRQVHLILSEWGKSNTNITEFCEPEQGLTRRWDITTVFQIAQPQKSTSEDTKMLLYFQGHLLKYWYLHKEEHTIIFGIVEKRDIKTDHVNIHKYDHQNISAFGQRPLLDLHDKKQTG